MSGWRGGFYQNIRDARIVEGTDKRTQDQINQKPSGDQFDSAAIKRYVVVDVIPEPALIDKTKSDYYVEELGVSNIIVNNTAGATGAGAVLDAFKLLPRNSIIAKRIDITNTGTPYPYELFFPFFPPHLSLPCKPGEHVWVLFESSTPTTPGRGYWMCRVPSSTYVDDVNHTHHLRNHDINFVEEKPDKNPEYTFKNFMRDQKGDVNSAVNAIENEDDDVFEKIITSAESSVLIVPEAIPQYRKRPGDFVIQGSNNALISLGTERKDVAYDISEQPETVQGKRKNYKFDKLKKPAELKEASGAIDIVVGRGQTEESLGKIVNATGKGINRKEVAKSLSETTNKGSKKNNKLGDPDLKNDRSRILVSQRTKIDENFGLKNYNESIIKDGSVKDDGNGDAGIVIKTDKLRLIARCDVEILVTDFDESKNPNGQQIKNEKSITTSWASIVIKRNGDIVFTPSNKGVIKLGGDDANLAVLCETAITGNDGTGLVTAPPIVDTMGGSQGTGAQNQGQFAKKVLLK